jgi:Zn-dependent M28 family amino/carboxypeptidase
MCKWYSISFVNLCVLCAPFLQAQELNEIITENETSRIINILASDSLKGRGNGQPGLTKAAEFIRDEFIKAGLKPVHDTADYFHLFTPDNRKKNQSFLYNIIGILPGRSKPEEIVLFSAHYDHLGVNRRKKDSIMNGANDNASGTTALLMLARYFADCRDNARTLLFCAFAGEELGLKGSSHFVTTIDTRRIIAGVNIEMIGIPQYGKKTVFITGSEFSSFAGIIQKNTDKADLAIIPDPDPDKELYKRSDNYPFVKAGVVAHSIMASGDTDKCYHLPCDETDRIDIPNMTAIIKAIAKATRTLVNGEDQPEKE